MKNHNETLRNIEAFRRPRAQDSAQDIERMRIDAWELFARRTQMLGSVEADISPQLREALRAKIAYENDSLIDLMERAMKTLEARKKLNKVLPSAHFARIPFDIHTI